MKIKCQYYNENTKLRMIKIKKNIIHNKIKHIYKKNKRNYFIYQFHQKSILKTKRNNFLGWKK